MAFCAALIVFVFTPTAAGAPRNVASATNEAWAGPATSDLGNEVAPIDPRGSAPNRGVLAVAGPRYARLAARPDSRQGEAPVLTASANGTDGYATLRWTPAAESDGPVEFELRVTSDALDLEGTTLYRGRDRATFVSGLPEGEHVYRVRARAMADGDASEAPWGPWSDPQEVVVEYHPIGLAWGLFGVGAVLVACIVSYLVLADARARRGRIRDAGDGRCLKERRCSTPGSAGASWPFCRSPG